MHKFGKFLKKIPFCILSDVYECFNFNKSILNWSLLMPWSLLVANCLRSSHVSCRCIWWVAVTTGYCGFLLSRPSETLVSAVFDVNSSSLQLKLQYDYRRCLCKGFGVIVELLKVAHSLNLLASVCLEISLLQVSFGPLFPLHYLCKRMLFSKHWKQVNRAICLAV